MAAVQSAFCAARPRFVCLEISRRCIWPRSPARRRVANRGTNASRSQWHVTICHVPAEHNVAPPDSTVAILSTHKPDREISCHSVEGRTARQEQTRCGGRSILDRIRCSEPKGAQDETVRSYFPGSYADTSSDWTVYRPSRWPLRLGLRLDAAGHTTTAVYMHEEWKWTQRIVDCPCMQRSKTGGLHDRSPQ
jgi:hypothetical protein